ncbi:MAG: ABC transporter permease, partial [Polyangiaceae bacterium]|nr:ABC transporter permease [Polyangiaceae bacterium]
MASASQAPTQAPQGSSLLDPLADLGIAFIDLFRAARDMYSVFVRTLYYTFRGKREPGAVAQQMFEIGNKSVFFVTV